MERDKHKTKVHGRQHSGIQIATIFPLSGGRRSEVEAEKRAGREVFLHVQWLGGQDAGATMDSDRCLARVVHSNQDRSSKWAMRVRLGGVDAKGMEWMEWSEERGPEQSSSARHCFSYISAVEAGCLLSCSVAGARLTHARTSNRGRLAHRPSSVVLIR
jgi:hypothetical protein